MEKGADILVSTVKDHFAREWDMLKEMISSIPVAPGCLPPGLSTALCQRTSR